MLTIINAIWGFGATRNNVTSLVKNRIEGDQLLPLDITSEQFGEVANLDGIVKDLLITYMDNETMKNMLIQENQGGEIRQLTIQNGVPSSNFANGNPGAGLLLL